MTLFGAEELAQRLGALAAVEEDMSSIPSSHIAAHSSVTSVSGDLTLFSDLYMQAHT